MRRRPQRLARALTAVVAITIAGCGSSAVATTGGTPGQSPSPSRSGTPSLVPAVPLTDRLQSLSLGIDLPFTETPCNDALTVVPVNPGVVLARCSGYDRFVADDPGPLGAFLTAPAVTTSIRYWDGAGADHDCVLSAASSSVDRYTDGTFPGHDLIGLVRPLLLDLRSPDHQTERIATC